jgi:hypothetical protein
LAKAHALTEYLGACRFFVACLEVANVSDREGLRDRLLRVPVGRKRPRRGREQEASSDEGLEEQVSPAEGLEEQASLDQGLEEPVSLDQGLEEQASLDQDSEEQVSPDEGLEEQASLDEGSEEQASPDEGLEEEEASRVRDVLSMIE